MNRRDRWVPLGARHTDEPPEVGQFLAHQHAVYRVLEVRDIPEVDWTDEQRRRFYETVPPHRRRPVVLRLRPAHGTTDDPRRRHDDLHLGMTGYRAYFFIYDNEHFPVCNTCREPLPCSEVHQQGITERAMADMARYEVPGVCPYCEKPVTARQKRVEFDVNVEIPGGPVPVVFHGRGDCWNGVHRYEKKYVADDPRRAWRFQCPGKITNHGDNTYDCSEGNLCPSPDVPHRSWSVCGCCPPDLRGCHPQKGATRRGSEVSTGRAASVDGKLFDI